MKTIIEQLFGSPPDDTRLSKWGRGFLEKYLRDGLGVMSKKETEVLVMHMLEESGCLEGKRNANHDLSLLLRIPETRVAALRYEAKLRYPPDDPEGYARIKLLTILWLAEPQADGKSIQLLIEDRYVRQYLSALAKRKHSVIDTSFNREIVDVRLEKLSPIIHAAFGEDIGKKFDKDFKKVLDAEHKVSFAEARAGFFKGLAQGAGGLIPAGIQLAAKGLLGMP